MMQPDVIGRIPKEPATYDDEGNQLTATVWRTGWHVNTPEPVPEWEAYRCDPQPTTPYRVYAGDVPPVCYRFPGEGTYQLERDKVFPPQEDSAL